MALKKRYLAAGVATFIVGFVLMFPARTAYTWFAPPALRLSGISGTVWNGSAAEGSISGAYLQNLSWSFSPLSLLKARLAYTIKSATSFGSISCVAGVNVTGDLIIQNLDSRLSLQQFSNQFQLQGFDGSLVVHLDSLVLRDGLPTAARGSIVLESLMARQISPDIIGDYRAEFGTDDEGIIASVEELSGVLDVAGTIRIGNDRSYSFVGKVAAHSNAPRGLTDQLRLLGSPDERGHREFRVEGQL